MRGVVLGYDAPMARGVISAPDGRFEFSRARWRSQAPPRVGMEVDFAVEQGFAVDIFPLSAPSSSGGMPDLRVGGVQLRPPLFIALVILLGCFLPLIAIPQILMQYAAMQNPLAAQFVQGIDLSLIGLFDWISLGLTMLRVQADQAAAAGATTISVLPLYLIYLIYAAPVLALWVAASELGRPGGASTTLRVWTGAFSLGVLVVPYIVFYVFLAMNPEISQSYYANAQAQAQLNMGANMIPIGVGAVLIMGGGLLMLLSAFGVIPNPRTPENVT